MRKIKWALACMAFTSVFTGVASASFHTFRINEIYSNPSGSVQFIELREVSGFNGQNVLTAAPDIKSLANDFTFPTNLPSATTANKTFILGTAAYAAIAGAPTPDYLIPANFFNPAGDTLQYGSAATDLTSFGAVPGNATQSLNRVGTSGSTFTVATNSPTNFAGATGSIPEPTSAMLVILIGMGLSLRRHRGQ